MNDKPHRYQLKLLGGFQFLAPDGTNIDVRSRKARALLGILVASPNGERSRIWLQEHLWSRGSSKASLRKELSLLRAMTDPYDVELFVDDAPRDIVRLNIDMIECDVLSENSADQGEFLEGLSIPTEEKFEEWLDNQRAIFNSPNVLGMTYRAKNRQPSSQIRIVKGSPALPATYSIGINPVIWEGGIGNGPEVPIVNDIITRIAKLLQNSGLIEIYDRRYNVRSQNMLTAETAAEHCQAELIIRANVLSSHRNISLTLLDKKTGRSILTRRETFRHSNEVDETVDFNSTKWFISDVADELIYRISHDQHISNDHRELLFLLQSSMEDMFGLANSRLVDAENKLDTALEYFKSSALMAWRSYISTIKIDNEESEDPALLREQARHFAAKSLELDRYNVLSLSLLTHVNAFTLKNLDGANDMMNRVKMIGSDHVMSYDADSLLNLYSGKFDKARQSALRAAYLGQFLPFRYMFMTTLCMINGLEGNYQEAIRAGELALSQQPLDAERPYPPTIRYLSRSYAHLGQQEKSDKLIQVLQLADENKKLGNEDDGDKVSPSELIKRFLEIGNDYIT